MRRLDRRAHPRSRGENVHTLVAIAHIPGSSPLTRGKPQAERFFGNRLGLIPAHAGKTTMTVWRPIGGPAHPRSRGENKEKADAKKTDAGSSPLTRGKRSAAGRVVSIERLIPAHAGKTRRWRPATPPTRAHPRSRGENRLDGPEGALDAGLIPAHAGKTVLAGHLFSSARAHPRSRGENILSFTQDAYTAGSSPLTRGKLGPVDLGDVTQGLIPAHAGKTRP